MHSHHPSFMDFWKDLDEEQRDIIRGNLLSTSAIMEELVNSVVEHLETSHNNCVKCCIGTDVPLMLEELNEKQMLMVLTIALRALAESRYNQIEKVQT